MRRVIMFTLAAVLAAAVAASPAEAAKKKKKMQAAAPAPAAVDSNEASWRLAKGVFVVFLPSWAIPIYLKVSDTKY